MSDTLRELRTTLARLGMISHAATCSYDGRTPKSTEEDIGGKRPPGSDTEYPPRRPGPDAAPTVWAAYEDEMDAWRNSYQRRTVAYFTARLNTHADQSALEALLREAEETLQAWKKTPLMAGKELPRGSFEWKCAVADDPRAIDVVTQFYSISRSSVNRYRAQYRGVRQTIWASEG